MIQELARIFNEIGLLLEIKGENPFKARAYYNAARLLDNLTPDQQQLINEGKIGELPGFGAALAQKVLEWQATGTIVSYEELKASIPPGLPELLKVPGLGAKKLNLLYSKLGITMLEQLEEACRQNRLIGLPGFGAKTQAKLLAGVEFIKEQRGQYLLAEVAAAAHQLLGQLSQCPGVVQAELAGSLRRRNEVVRNVDLVAAAAEPAAVVSSFINLPDVATTVASSPAAATVNLRSGVRCNLRVVKPEAYPYALLYFTGSCAHNTALRRYAAELGFELTESGLSQGDALSNCRDEAELYQRLQMAYIPPELREGQGEIEAARDNRLPQLVRPEDLQGVFHVHTNYSDGVNSLREMVEAAIELGYKYLGVADHSRTAVYAYGLQEAALKRQFAEIDALNREYPGFRIFKGIESEILPNGDLDYPSELLAEFDLVIGSVHSQFGMGKTEMTARLLKALDNPYLTILGHPTGRILLQRPGYELDLEAVIAKAAEKRVIIEFNANPYRYDLDWRWCRQAREAGVLIAVNPDAHSTAELAFARSGLAVAIKGWLQQQDIFNTRPAAEIQLYLEKHRSK